MFGPGLPSQGISITAPTKVSEDLSVSGFFSTGRNGLVFVERWILVDRLALFDPEMPSGLFLEDPIPL